MARTLFEAEPHFREVMFRADRVVRAAGGPGLVDALFGPRDEAAWLENLEISHPAIVAVEWGVVAAMAERGIRPAAVMGSSLGEYAAMAFAGVFEFEAMLRLALDQARLALAHAPPGGMLAILGPVSLAQAGDGTFEGCAIAAVSSPEHFVVSGPAAALERCADAMRAAGVTTARLPVNRPFHAPEMDGAEAHFRAAAGGLAPAAPSIPIYSCASGGRLRHVDVDHMWRLVREPIEIAGTFARVEADFPGAAFIEVGPGASLVNFARRRPVTDSDRYLAILNPLAPEAAMPFERMTRFAGQQ